ncbi:MAG: hypothetical protein SFV81_11210 [Pirellulaceae bacterium]|nr:hypothetical protein [Pirellulaceae bacterium]
MTKHQKSNNSTQATKQFSVRQMLRSALVVGVVSGFACPAMGQTELTLPSFPEDATSLALPVAQDLSLPPAFTEPKAVGPSTSKRVASLLGLKKLAPTSPAACALPAFPSTQPTLLPQSSPTEQLSNASAPSIFRSTSTKAGDSQTLHNDDSIALASADESLSQIEIPPTLSTQPALASDELSEEETSEAESLDVSLSELSRESSESLTDTLIDIEIPKGSEEQQATTTQQNLSDVPRVTTQLDQTPVLLQQRAPELVKRLPAMQLHIGGGRGAQSTISDSVQPASAPTSYSMSDADEDNQEDATESESEVTEAPKTKKTLNVRIEGEPVQVVPRSAAASEAIVTPQKQLSFDPVGLRSGVGSPTASTPAANTPAANTPAVSTPAVSTAAVSKPAVSLPAVNLPAISSSSTIQSVSSQSASIQSISGQSSGAKAQTDKGFDQPPTIGERLEVGLHESINVESKQPISGLSVEHPELCQVLKSGERSLSVVGLKAGQTRVALFTTSASGERKIEIREVIIAGTENRQADMKSLATEISKSVRRMYPNSRIEVIAEEDGLAVQGYAGSEAEAKKIIGLIRKTSLQPVVDRLATYK